jgi:tRNA(Ile)-lysidine synthase
MLRPEAQEDLEFVRNLAKSYSIPFHMSSQDVALWSRKRRMNLEEAGRELRYRFLKEAAARLGCSKIATGHTMTDQAETFFMRLIRGSGMRGLAGIFPIVEGMIVRPMLQVEREEVEAYLKENKLAFRVDKTNFDKRFLRNRIRLEILPLIRDRFDSNIVAHIGQLADILQEEDAFMESLALEESEEVMIGEGDETKLHCQGLSRLPLGLQRRIVRMFISRLKGDIRGISFEDVESVLKMGEGKAFHLRKELFLLRQEGMIFRQVERLPEVVYEYSWEGRRGLSLPELSIRLEGKKVNLLGKEDFCFDDDTVAYLDADKLHFPLTVRSRRKGDRYHPLGAPGSQKLKEIMRAKGIPAQARNRHPVFLSGNEIIWVLGLPVSEKFKITDATKVVFEIRKG